VGTLVTPGSTVDVIVTEQGVAVNPRRSDLVEKFKKNRIPVRPIAELRELVENMVGKPEPIEYTDKVVGLVTYRDGSVIDLIHQVK
jgi:citrate lyase subunit alpha/citrate CoA-transferase